jgi:hypothetical protein
MDRRTFVYVLTAGEFAPPFTPPLTIPQSLLLRVDQVIKLSTRQMERPP